MSIVHLSGLDYVVLAIILFSTAFALKKGLVREVVSLLALVGGFILAAIFYGRVGSMFADLTRTKAIAHLLAFLAIFLGTLALGAVASFAVNRFLKATSVAWFDRLLGAIFGFLRGWAIASVIVLALVAFPVRKEVVSRSSVAPLLLAGAQAAVVMVPQELKDRFREEYKKVLEAWNTHRSST